jgi:recombination protein RecT
MSTAITVADRRRDIMRELHAMERTVFARLLTAELRPARFVQIVGDALLREPSLLECTPASIVRCARAAAELGLELHSPSGHAYMVPMWISKKNVREATFVVGYRGLVRLMLESPRITAVRATVVYDGDDVDYREGTDPRIHHVPRGRSEVMVAAYAVAHYASGLAVPCWMWGRQILEIERAALDKSKGRPTPWSGMGREEMWRKTPLRRLAKTMDLTERMSRAMEHEAALDARIFGRDDDESRMDALKAKLEGAAAEAADDNEGQKA